MHNTRHGVRAHSGRVVRAATALLALAPAIGTPGCEKSTLAGTCEELGLCDPPPKPPELVDVVCDRSLGAPCDRATLDETLGIVLRRVADEPGSQLRLWMMGGSAATTSLVGQQTVPVPTRTGERARSAHALKFTAQARAFLDAASAQEFERPAVRRSPIAESIAKVGMTDAGGLPRRIVVVTDAREVTPLLDFECRRLPTDAQFRIVLGHLGVLAPGTLADAEVDFVHVDGRPVGGRPCAVTVARETRIRELWTAALRATGASPVHITSGPVRVVDPAGAPPVVTKEN